MDEVLVEEALRALDRCTEPARVRVRDLGGLDHHLAELSGLLEARTVGLHRGCFDVQRVATHAGPGQTADDAGRRRVVDRLFREDALAQKLADLGGTDLDTLRFLEDLHGALAHDLLDLLLDTAHARVARVAVDDLAQRGLRDGELGALEVQRPELPRQEVAVGDLQLLLQDVSGQLDDFHAVEEGPRNGVQLVRGADEQHVRQVVADVQIVIEELAVLFRVERLEQRRRGIAAEARADLVDFVEHDDGVVRLADAQRLQELAGHGADVRAAVALDLRLVAHAAQGEAVELAVEAARDGLADGGLAHSGRTDQADDRAGKAAFEQSRRDELEDARLHVVEPVVVFVQHLAGALERRVVAAFGSPGQHRQPVEVVAGDGELWRGGLEHAQLFQFLVDALFRLVAGRACPEPLGEALELLLLVVLLEPQLLLDALELLAQEELALLLADPLFDLLRDLRLELGDVELAPEQLRRFLQPWLELQRLEHLLQLGAVRARQVGGVVGEACGVLEIALAEQQIQLFLEQRVELYQVLDRVDDGQGVGLELVTDRPLRFVQVFDLGDLVGVGAHDAPEPYAVTRAEQHREPARLVLLGVQELGDHPDGMQLGHVRSAVVGFFGRCLDERQPDQSALGLDRILDQLRNALALDHQGRDDLREERTARQRDDREAGRIDLARDDDALVPSCGLPVVVDDLDVGGTVVHVSA